MADGGVKAGLVAGRGRIDMVQVPREIRVRGLDPDRSAKPDAASIEVLMEPGHPIQPLGDHREQLVVRGRGALGHSDGADRDRRPLPLHLQPDEVEGMESVSAIGHGPMVPPGPAARQCVGADRPGMDGMPVAGFPPCVNGSGPPSPS